MSCNVDVGDENDRVDDGDGPARGGVGVPTEGVTDGLERDVVGVEVKEGLFDEEGLGNGIEDEGRAV